jgi:hypothetical protein
MRKCREFNVSSVDGIELWRLARFVPIHLLCLLVPTIFAVRGAAQNEPAFEVKSIVNKDPSSLLGYTLGFPITNHCNAKDQPGHPPDSTRARIMDVDDQQSYELLSELPPWQFSTAFRSWLKDHHSATVQVVLQLPRTNLIGNWIDEFVVNPKTGHFATPTDLPRVSYINGALIPYQGSSETGYLFAATNQDGELDSFYKMNFDGSQKQKLVIPLGKGESIGHGCVVSPKGVRMVCEVALQHDPNTCPSDYPQQAQVFDTQTGQAVSREFPTPNGTAVAWSPDGERFVYLTYTGSYCAKTYHDNAFELAERHKDKDGHEEWKAKQIGGKTADGKEVKHSLAPCNDLGETDTPMFANGSDAGQWSEKGDAYYNSAEFYDPKTGRRYNRIGFIPLAPGSNQDLFTFLTPEGMDARYAALAPSPKSLSFVFLGRPLDAGPCARADKTCKSPVQIYRYDSRKAGEQSKKLSQILGTSLVFDLHWRSDTDVPIDPEP